MTTRAWIGLLWAVTWIALGCGGDDGGTDADVPPADGDVQEDGPGADADADVPPADDAGGDTGSDVEALDDSAADDGVEDAGDGEVDPCPPPVCGTEELCGETTQGDGLDNDCDGEVDETCTCEGPGTTLECFPGDPAICPTGAACLGACVRGYQTCGADGTWGPCEGATLPDDEICDGMDNDCDDTFDEGVTGCVPPVHCPRPLMATPMSWIWLDGGSIFPDTYTSWQWELTCPPTVTTCPTPEDPTSRDTRVLLISSGTYRARATIVAGTETHTCEYAIVVRGAGLRVELTWDTQGSANGDTDVDIHLHNWNVDTVFHAADDCHWANCKGSTPPPYIDWGLAATPDLAACQDAPHGEGAAWVTRGACANPRLDVDMITCTTGVTDPADTTFCAPENINVDNPPLGQPVRVMVNYHSAHSFVGTTNATVNIFCGGAIRGTLTSPLVNGSSAGATNDNWLVADVMFYETACGLIECEIVPLEVVQTGDAFGPPWSTFAAGP